MQRRRKETHNFAWGLHSDPDFLPELSVGFHTVQKHFATATLFL
jgi:hypothetical protein